MLLRLFSIFVFVLTAGTAVAQVAPSEAFKRQCERELPATSIRVTSLPSEMFYDFSLPVRALTAKAPFAPDSFTLGLTEAAFSLQSNLRLHMLLEPGTGWACGRPEVTITLAAGPQRVYVASEFPRGSCVFDDVAKHEFRHVYANQNQIEKVADQLSAELKASFGNRVFYGGATQLQPTMAKHIKDEWLPWAQQRFGEVKAVHAKIDSKEEYARNNVICGGAVPAAIHGRPR